MSFVRRSFAALSGLFLMQLTLLGSGTLCAIHQGGAPHAVTAHAAHEMARVAAGAPHEASASVVAQAVGSPASTDICGGPGGHDGCGSPWAPGHCSARATCDSPAAVPSGVLTTVATRMVAVTLPSPELAASGPSFAPELPPPRA